MNENCMKSTGWYLWSRWIKRVEICKEYMWLRCIHVVEDAGSVPESGRAHINKQSNPVVGIYCLVV